MSRDGLYSKLRFATIKGNQQVTSGSTLSLNMQKINKFRLQVIKLTTKTKKIKPRTLLTQLFIKKGSKNKTRVDF